jgi:hypothetical protein
VSNITIKNFFNNLQVNHKTVTRQSLLRQELRFLDLEWDK